jgi:ATP-dependent HslUV protease subunit HslV
VRVYACTPMSWFSHVQVTLGSSVVKPDARKVRTLNDGKIMVGFAGATADCFTLIERFEEQLEVHSNQLLRAGVELAKNWRMDKYLRHLNAMIIAVDKDVSVTITGQGDIMSEPDDGVISIGSGSIYARSAARALIDIDGLSAEDIAMKSMKIASEQCIYTNDTFVVERLSYGAEETETPEGEKKEE